MKLLPHHIASKLFGEDTNSIVSQQDYDIKDESEWVELPIDYSPVKPWFDDYASNLWSKYSAILEPCLMGDYTLPTKAPIVTGSWQLWSNDTWLNTSTDDLPPCLILDTEAVQNQGVWHPICAIAFGINPHTNKPSVYAWVRTWSAITLNEDLIPFPNNRLVVGWNVSYDRQYLVSEYQVKDSGNRFLDGMGWAQSLWGISDQQLPSYKTLKFSNIRPLWVQNCTEVGLASVYQHIFKRPLDKSTRTAIEKMGWYDWVKEIDDILVYCAKDVSATQECCIDMYWQLDRKFVGSPISWIGQLEMSTPLISLDKNWYDYLQRCQRAEYEVERRHTALLTELAYRKADSGDLDPRVGDWTPLKSGVNKGKPRWLVDYLKGVSMGKRTTPILLGLQWGGKDLCWRQIDSHNGYWETVDGEKLPHPDGGDKNLSTPLICDKGSTYESYVKEGKLTSTLADFDLLQLFDELNSLTNWRAISGRCESLRVVKTSDGFLTIPQVVVMGTQSRRAKDNLWLVAPKPEPRKIGSELRAMVNAPMGWRIVGADFDS